ncbi:hypothetical protein [Sinorhizobium medicae]
MNRYNKNNSMVGQSKRDATRLIAGGVVFVAEPAVRRRLQETLMGLLNLSAGTTRKQEPHSSY